MKYIVDVNGHRMTVEFDGSQAVVEGERLEVALTLVAGTPVRLVRIGEQVHRIVARRGTSRGQWVLDVDGARVEAEALDERMRAIKDLTAASASASGPAPLLAPMPGLVVRVAVAVGDPAAGVVAVAVGTGVAGVAVAVGVAVPLPRYSCAIQPVRVP